MITRDSERMDAKWLAMKAHELQIRESIRQSDEMKERWNVCLTLTRYREVVDYITCLRHSLVQKLCAKDEGED